MPPSSLRQPIVQLLFQWAQQLTHMRPKRFELRGKTALVTGGSRGLGLEIARVLVARGASVALLARDEAELDNAVLDVHDRRSDESVRVLGHACDLSDSASMRATLDILNKKLGPIDVLVNNAGMIQVGPLDAMTLDDFEAAMQLHFAAPLRMSLWLRDEMRERGGGRIANIASIGGIVAPAAV
jgi:NAD(P)-dependent dehydrogenase (short-subunit alcohol dehydrogenase family)